MVAFFNWQDKSLIAIFSTVRYKIGYEESYVIKSHQRFRAKMSDFRRVRKNKADTLFEEYDPTGIIRGILTKGWSSVDTDLVDIVEEFPKIGNYTPGQKPIKYEVR